MSTKHKLALVWLAILFCIIHADWSMPDPDPSAAATPAAPASAAPAAPAWEFLACDFSPDAMAAKWPAGPQWIPLYQNVMSGKPIDLYNFLSLLFVAAALAFVGRIYADRVGYRGLWSTPARAWFWGCVLGLVLALGQLAIPGRTPATGNVLCYAFGAALGSYLARRHRAESPP